MSNEKFSKARGAITLLCTGAFQRIGTLLFSLVAMIVCPLIPILIEWLKSGEVKKESYLITAAVLSAALLVAAEHNFYRAFYTFLFVVSLILDILVYSGPVASGMDRYSGGLLWAVAIVHMAERFWWHVVLDRPFPDSLRASDGGA